MKCSLSDLRSDDPVRLEAISQSAPKATISEPAKTLLVVDDDKEVRELEAEILSWEGYNVLQAESAAEALRVAASTETLHLIITDFSMPEVDGLELSHRLRAVHPRTPVLMVSGSLPLLRNRTEELDRVELLAKPFLLKELLLKVRTLVNAAVLHQRPKPRNCD